MASNTVVPMMSSSPPPMDDDEEPDDEFGGFNNAADSSYDLTGLSQVFSSAKAKQLTWTYELESTYELGDLDSEEFDSGNCHQPLRETKITTVGEEGIGDIEVELSEVSNTGDNFERRLEDSDSLNDTTHQEWISLNIIQTECLDVLRQEVECSSNASVQGISLTSDDYVEIPNMIDCIDKADLIENVELSENDDFKDHLSKLVSDYSSEAVKNGAGIEIGDFTNRKGSELSGDDLVDYSSGFSKTINVSQELDDEFGEFLACEKDLNILSDMSTSENRVDDFSNADNQGEDFGEFYTSKEVRDEFDDKLSTCEKSVDDFGDFSSNFANFEPVEVTQSAASNVNIVPSTGTSISVSSTLQESEMEFDELTLGKVGIRIQNLLPTFFPLTEDIYEDSSIGDVSGGSLWNKLRDMESGSGLSFQWTQSKAYAKMLWALNIDSRNILLGSRWNPSMPRFAANLGFGPLEPVKAVCSAIITTTTPEEQSESIVLEPNGTVRSKPDELASVPPAQFDWTSSGLTNPLDGVEKQLLKSPPSTKSSQSLPSTIQPSQTSQLIQNILKTPSSLPAAIPKPRIYSPEVRKIVDLLPDLSFVRSPVLMFPIRSSPDL